MIYEDHASVASVAILEAEVNEKTTYLCSAQPKETRRKKKERRNQDGVFIFFKIVQKGIAIEQHPLHAAIKLHHNKAKRG